MRSGVEVRVTYVDEHLIELRIVASNGQFAAPVDVYASRDAPRNMAHMLLGFPARPSDLREFQFGSFAKGVGGDGGVQLRFYCTDAAGHAAVEVRVETKSLPGRGISTACFGIPVEPAAVDVFVEQLGRMSATVGDRAGLEASA